MVESRLTMKKTIQVVGAVIYKDNKILCAKRPKDKALANYWEFPGGKIEPGETEREALEREIQEELKCDIQINDKLITTVYEYDFAIISLTTFYCELIEGEPVLTEHQAIKWLEPENLEQLKWAPADIPAVEKIREK